MCVDPRSKFPSRISEIVIFALIVFTSRLRTAASADIEDEVTTSGTLFGGDRYIEIEG